MLTPIACTVLLLAKLALAHGGHEHSGPAPGETIQQYAQRHMVKEHHIDNFDIRSFFHLHDLNRDGYWDKAEIEAVYGVHHAISQKKSKDEVEHQKKADHIVKTVLSIMDKDGDERVNVKEFEAVGLDGLPNFDNMGAEGHHYDEESEFFLHHEEEFHSTPETQTDESYNHPEDLEHFGHHEKIEKNEIEREAQFAGVSPDEIIQAQESAAAAAEAAQKSAEANTPSGTETSQRAGFTRVVPAGEKDPTHKFKNNNEGSWSEEWGAGPDGYKPPAKPAEKMKRNLPYKYKFRRNWGDF